MPFVAVKFIQTKYALFAYRAYTINTILMKIHNVILSGGIGSRLWPLSRQKNPKQFLKLFGGKSLFELTAERNASMVDSLIVVGNREHVAWSKEMLSSLSLSQQFIVEACPRNTAAAIAFAALSVDPDDILLVTPSDHLIEQFPAYKQAVEQAVSLAKEGNIVTFGIVPTKPETGYGYIEHQGDKVVSFREKPDLETAKEFLHRGGFLWNSGMFCFRAGVLLEELQRYEPAVYTASKKAWSVAVDGVLDESLSMEIPSISIDYAVMERSKKIRVVSASFEWNDLGSFDSLYSYFHHQGVPVDAHGNMVIGTDVFTAFVGVSNTIFVYTSDAFLVVQKDASQGVKEVYSALEQSNSPLR